MHNNGHIYFVIVGKSNVVNDEYYLRHIIIVVIIYYSHSAC